MLCFPSGSWESIKVYLDFGWLFKSPKSLNDIPLMQSNPTTLDGSVDIIRRLERQLKDLTEERKKAYDTMETYQSQGKRALAIRYYKMVKKYDAELEAIEYAIANVSETATTLESTDIKAQTMTHFKQVNKEFQTYESKGTALDWVKIMDNLNSHLNNIHDTSDILNQEMSGSVSNSVIEKEFDEYIAGKNDNRTLEDELKPIVSPPDKNVVPIIDYKQDIDLQKSVEKLKGGVNSVDIVKKKLDEKKELEELKRELLGV